MCDCLTCCIVKRDIKYCYEIYKQYQWILDSYGLDYYVNNQWSNLSTSWCKILEKMTLMEIASILDINSPVTKLLPLSILTLRKLLQFITVQRASIPIENLYSNNNTSKHSVSSITICEPLQTEIIKGSDHLFINHRELKNSFWKHISPKKKHEITLMAQICVNVAQKSKCNAVIDFGSGLGHLSRILAYGYGLRVFCLETQKTLSEQAKKLDSQFEQTAFKHLSKVEFDKLVKPVHININIDNTVNLQHLLEVCERKNLTFALGINNDDAKFGVVGLHPCGDLAAILLQFFKTNKYIRFINIASCCYMKLTTKDNKTQLWGYPLSKFLNENDNSISYVARELSCHSIETYVDRLKTGNCDELKIHAYRAVLEAIIVKYQPDKQHIGLRNVKCKNNLKFSEYCLKATNGLDLTIPQEEIESKETLKYLNEWKKVVIFYSLRLMFAPVIETIILLDRYLYIAESDIDCILVPIFNPKLSPRNHILIGIK